MTYPLLSVIIPAYNHAQYIAGAVQSVAAQDYPELETILVDDGSTDNTAEIAEKALQHSGRPYTLLRQENAGAHAALNRGIQAASGEYIAILNSDDRYLPGRLSTLFTALSTSGRRFAYSQVSHIDRIGFPHPYQACYLRQLEEARRFPTLSFELLRENIAVTTGNFFFHRSLYEEVGGFAPYLTCHDWDYILRVLLVEEPLFVDQALLEYRIHPRGALQEHLDLVDEEITRVMLNYLTHLGTAKNQLAPGPEYWGQAWDDFSDHFLGRIRAFPPVRAQLEAMRSQHEAPAGITMPEGPLPPLPECKQLSEVPVDLDLTRITLDIPTPLRDAKTQNRLLLILPWMMVGGAERFSLNLIDQLKQRDWQISLVCTSPSDNLWQEEFAQRTDDILILPDTVPIKDYPRYLRYFIELRQFDAILLQGSLEGYRLLPVLRAFFPQLPILDYLHMVTPDWMDGGFPRLSCLYRDGLDLTITSCDDVRRWMVSEGVAEDRLFTCPIGVDENRWKPDPGARERVRLELGISPEEVVVIYAARLEAQKQPLVFAETLHLLKERGVPFRAIIAGDGSLREELEARLAHYGLNEQVMVLGAVKSEDMPPLLAASDLFFLPSQNEGISAAMYEAMAAGLPVVGANVGGQAELVTPECGLLLEPIPEKDQPTAYASALKSLIEDSSRRQRMGIASRERILSAFTLGQMGERMHGILTGAIQLKHEGHLSPLELTDWQCLVRDTQHIVEYLQARQEWQKSKREWQKDYQDLKNQYDNFSDQYFALLQPRPPSHWFYLWIRQLFLPVLDFLNQSKAHHVIVRVQKWLKHTLTQN